MRAHAASEPREAALCGAISAGLSAFMVLVLPRGGDLAAHLYRTSLVQHGILVWDNLWFAGQYPLSSYSLLYYPLATLVGNAALGIAGVVLAAAIFASIALREWTNLGRWPARTFAFLLAGQAFTAAYPYDLGLATLLGAVWAIQRRRTWIAAGGTLLTLAFSPLAFVFLALTLFALFLRRRRFSRQIFVLAGALGLAAGVQLALLELLPSPGIVYPYGAWRLAAGLAICTVGIALSLSGRAGWPIASIFLIWAAASVVTSIVASPIGHNLIRADVFVVPLMLVAAARADFRPRALAIAGIAGALAANVGPYLSMIPDRESSVDATAAYWAPVIRFLRAHDVPKFRVEVVPTANHWESYYIPHAGFALARGWYRQLDMADDAALYAPHLTPASYREWLRQHAVRFVVLPHLPLEAIDASREATLLQSPHSGLRRMLRTSDATIYELRDPTPLITGPARAAVTALQSSRLLGYVDAPGTYYLRARYSPYWSVTRGAICLAPAKSAMTLVHASRAGPFTIQAAETPGSVVADLLDGDSHSCRPDRRPAVGH
jgi:hypothetical protein